MPEPAKPVEPEDLEPAGPSAAEHDLDEALEETFPASDPISPMQWRRLDEGER